MFNILDSDIVERKIHDFANEFIKLLIQLLNNDTIQVEFCRKFEDCSRMFKFCFNLIQRRRDVQNANVETLLACAYRCLVNIFKNHITLLQIDKVKNFVLKKQNFSKHSLQLIEYCILEECKLNSSFTSSFACEQAVEILDCLERAATKEQIADEMTNFVDLLQSIIRIQNKFIAWHQRQHINNVAMIRCETCLSSSNAQNQNITFSNRVVTMSLVYPILLGNLQRLADSFLMIVKMEKGLTKSLVSKAAISLLSFWNSRDIRRIGEDLLILSVCVFDFYDMVKTFDVVFSFEITKREESLDILNRLVRIRVPWTSSINNGIYDVLLNDKFLCNVYVSLIINRLYTRSLKLTDMYGENESDPTSDLAFSKTVKSLICATSHSCNAILQVDKDYEYLVVCNTCEHNIKIDEHSVILPIEISDDYRLNDASIERILQLIQSSDSRIRSNIVDALPLICLTHTTIICAAENLYWTNIFNDDLLEVKIRLTRVIQKIMDAIEHSDIDRKKKDDTVNMCMKKLLIATTKSLENDDINEQTCIVELIGKFATSETTSERTLLMCFRKMIFFLINPKSRVVANATFYVETMCRSKGITPKRFYNWHKENILRTVICLAVSVFLEYGLLLEKTLCNFNEVLGYSNLKRELMKNDFAIMTAIILPWTVKYPACQRLLENMCALTNLHIDHLFDRTFIQIYVYVHLRESPDVVRKCLDFITGKTGQSVSYFLLRDAKRSLSEVLLSYHKNQDFALNAIRILITKKENIGSNEIPTDQISQYLAKRFLGVLNSFGTILTSTDFEKNFQKDALLSLGGIIRAIGTNYITPYRFKILELLNSVRILNVNELTDICVSVWKIFIGIVDISKIGPLLSTIVVLLGPLLETHAFEVNEILESLIIYNGSLNNRFISDLFFLETIPVCEKIKAFVTEQSQKFLVDDTFVKRLKLYTKQINHENLVNVGVRIHGLSYLTDLFCQNRNELNDLIFGQDQMNPIIVNLLKNLMEGCRHVDENLHIPSAICLGQLGAIEPSFLPRNYAPESHFALSIHTDNFSILALDQLCQAYQSQKNTHLVDGFSLAIQEILVTRGVDPKYKKKMEIWNSIPEKMRPLMEPFLTSSYTPLIHNMKAKTPPVFGSSFWTSTESWAFHWALNMMSMITEEPTKNLLTSFKASMKNHSGILFMFLPYVLLHALQFATFDDINKIEEEFRCVFDSVRHQTGDESNYRLSLKCAKIAINQVDFLNSGFATTAIQVNPRPMNDTYA